MTTGIDTAGRAFRWAIGSDGPVGVSYMVMGCPPMGGDVDEVMLWNDSYAYRPQVCNVTGSVDMPAKLISIEMQWKSLYGFNSERYQEAAKNIVMALKEDFRCPPHGSGATCLAIPDMLMEDAQDSLLNALRYYGYSAPILLWRPIAIMLQWLNSLSTPAVNLFQAHSDSNVWVLDLDAPCLEITRLNWRLHKKDPEWVAPVRSNPYRSKIFAKSYSTLRTAWDEIFAGIEERNQLILAQTAPEVQECLELGKSSFDVWVCKNHRWRRERVHRPSSLNKTCEALKLELKEKEQRQKQNSIKPKHNDFIVVNGWLARLYPEEITTTLKDLYGLSNIIIVPADTLAKGAQLFADRYSKGLPTYYDQLPEYKIWTDNGWRLLVEKDQEEVEPGNPWRLDDEELQTSFSIGQYRDNLSFLVQRNPVFDPDNDFARRLKVDLKQMSLARMPLYLDVEVKPANGSARFDVKTTDNEKPFVFDERTMTQSTSLSYGLGSDISDGKKTTKEPEHKGYLEPQPVIGRIYDDQSNLNLLRMLVEHFNDLEPFGELQDAVRQYRTDEPNININSVENCILEALARWGYHSDYRICQPTRGLFGTKNLSNIEISRLCGELSVNLWQGMPPAFNLQARNFWSKRQNYLHVFACEEYKTYIRHVLANPHIQFQSWSEAYAPGYILGAQAEDLKLLSEYSIARNFDVDNDGYADKHFWAFFRMLCWHPEVKIEEEFVRNYLYAVIAYLNRGPGLDGHSRKYLAFAILFALRVRENQESRDFLLREQDRALINQLVSLFNENGPLMDVNFPVSMINHLNGVEGNLSDYVRRFILRKDTIEDRELGSSIAVSD